ncbi:twin-arginine translocase TatA/TatE family subunit [Acinetobacter seifertii]|uniref:twin-arginine translocase TatA/TatE family subunit n=1 Tax=Acinetobacter seifertii TaxID=1530123 RepID=UPI00321A5695
MQTSFNQKCLFACLVIFVNLKNLGKDLGGAIKDFKDSVNSDDQKLLQNQQYKDISPVESHNEKQNKI